MFPKATVRLRPDMSLWVIVGAVDKAMEAAGASNEQRNAYLAEVAMAPDIAATRRITERWVTVEQG